jgi:hypothetical protein
LFLIIKQSNINVVLELRYEKWEERNIVENEKSSDGKIILEILKMKAFKISISDVRKVMFR